MEGNKTGCTCNFEDGKGGYCEKFCIFMTPHFAKLCKTHQGYYNMWAEGRGPNSETTDCPEKFAVKTDQKNEECNTCSKENVEEKPKELPSLWQQALNFGSSVIDHAKSGFSHVSEEEKRRRLSICESCPLLIKEEFRCSSCGCFMLVKASWQTASCPEGKW